MKSLFYLCTLLLLASACSGVEARTPGDSSDQTLQVTVTLTALPEIIIASPQPALILTQTPATLEGAGCTPALIPAGFFQDSERLLGFREDLLQVYNLKTHRVENQINLPSRVVKAAVSPDGQTLAAGLEDFSILLIHTSDQQVLHTLKAHTGIISGLAFSPEGDRLLTASEDNWVRIWSLDGQEVDAFQPSGADGLSWEVMGVGISSDWQMLATIPFDGWMNLWSLPDHKLLGSFEGSIQGGYSGSQAAFSPDGQYLAQHLGAGGGYLSLWRIDTGELLLRGENITGGVDFSPDGRYLAYAEMLAVGGGHVVVRTQDGSQLIYDLYGPEVSLPAVPLFSPDSKLLVAGDYIQGNLLVWTTADGQLVSLGESSCP